MRTFRDFWFTSAISLIVGMLIGLNVMCWPPAPEKPTPPKEHEYSHVDDQDVTNQYATVPEDNYLGLQVLALCIKLAGGD